MNFHMDAGTPSQKAIFAAVLDPATRTEMKSTGFLLGDGLGGVRSTPIQHTDTHTHTHICEANSCAHVAGI